jgi:SAM-dependent methyltransferase
MKKYTVRTTCRVCKHKTTQILDLGLTPLADRFVDSPQAQEKRYPLSLGICTHCWLTQLRIDVDDKELFAKEYAFFTGTTSSVQHFKDYAKTVKALYPEQSKGFVVEIGSNDGTLLKEFKGAENILGVDPADKPFDKALDNNVPTYQKFFSYKVARDIKVKNDLIMANNVLAHVIDPLDFMKGVARLLAYDGVAVFEFQYLPDLLFKNEFDNVYHEHRSFFSLTSFANMLKKAKLMIEHVKHIDMQGGSLRVYVRQKGHAQMASVENMLSDEMQMGITSPAAYQGIQARLEYNKFSLLRILKDLKFKGKKIYGYGASAKSNTMFNYYGIDSKLVDKIADTTPFKFGKFTPGTHIPIVKQSDKDMPDYYLVSIWNYLPQILLREKKFIKAGGKFIVPIPFAEII